MRRSTISEVNFLTITTLSTRADELTLEHLRVAADIILGPSKYGQHELTEALLAINCNRRAKSVTATKAEFAAFIRATLSSQHDAGDTLGLGGLG